MIKNPTDLAEVDNNLEDFIDLTMEHFDALNQLPLKQTSLIESELRSIYEKLIKLFIKQYFIWNNPITNVCLNDSKPNIKKFIKLSGIDPLQTDKIIFIGKLNFHKFICIDFNSLKNIIKLSSDEALSTKELYDLANKLNMLIKQTNILLERRRKSLTNQLQANDVISESNSPHSTDTHKTSYAKLRYMLKNIMGPHSHRKGNGKTLKDSKELKPKNLDHMHKTSMEAKVLARVQNPEELKHLLPPRHKYVPTVNLSFDCAFCRKPMWMGLRCKICKLRCHTKCADSLSKHCSIETILLNNHLESQQSNYLSQRLESLVSRLTYNSKLPPLGWSSVEQGIPKTKKMTASSSQATDYNFNVKRRSLSTTCLIPLLYGAEAHKFHTNDSKGNGHYNNKIQNREIISENRCNTFEKRRSSKDDLALLQSANFYNNNNNDVNNFNKPTMGHGTSNNINWNHHRIDIEIVSSQHAIPLNKTTIKESSSIYSTSSQPSSPNITNSPAFYSSGISSAITINDKPSTKLAPKSCIFVYDDSLGPTSLQFPNNVDKFGPSNKTKTKNENETIDSNPHKPFIDNSFHGTIKPESEPLKLHLASVSPNKTANSNVTEETDSIPSQTTDSRSGSPDKFPTRQWTKSLSLREWTIPIDQIEIGELIGIGWQSRVFRGNWHGKVAIKILDIEGIDFRSYFGHKKDHRQGHNDSNNILSRNKTPLNSHEITGDNKQQLSDKLDKNTFNSNNGAQQISQTILNDSLMNQKFARDQEIKLKEIMKKYRPYLDSFRMEINILRKTRHHNLILFMGACIKPPVYAIVTSLCKGPTLYKHIHVYGNPITMDKVLSYATQIAQGMGYLHAKGICHKDLRSKNVFIEHGDRIIISDFGIFCVAKLLRTSLNDVFPATTAKREGEKAHSFYYLSIPPGWIYYLAPEILRNIRIETVLSDNTDQRKSTTSSHHYPKHDVGTINQLATVLLNFTYATDVFSYGALLYEMINGEWPFYDKPTESVIWQVGSGLLAPFLTHNANPWKTHHSIASSALSHNTTTGSQSHAIMHAITQHNQFLASSSNSPHGPNSGHPNNLSPTTSIYLSNFIKSLIYNYCWPFDPLARLSFSQISKILEHQSATTANQGGLSAFFSRSPTKTPKMANGVLYNSSVRENLNHTANSIGPALKNEYKVESPFDKYQRETYISPNGDESAESVIQNYFTLHADHTFKDRSNNKNNNNSENGNTQKLKNTNLPFEDQMIITNVKNITSRRGKASLSGQILEKRSHESIF